MTQETQKKDEERIYWLGQIHHVNETLKKANLEGKVPVFLLNIMVESGQYLNELEKIKQ